MSLSLPSVCRPATLPPAKRFLGYLVYTDANGLKRKTAFCRQYNPDTKRFSNVRRPGLRVRRLGRDLITAMRLFHRTRAHNAKSILREGFRDAEGNYGVANTYRGVWLSDTPLEANEGAWGDTLLVVELDESDVAPFEWVEEGKAFREFLVPAAIINRKSTPVIAT